MNESVCEHCDFWFYVSPGMPGLLGQCRRYGPSCDTGAPKTGAHPTRQWPLTVAAEWCGEFRHAMDATRPDRQSLAKAPR